MERFGAVRTLVGGARRASSPASLLLAAQGVHASYFPGLFFAFLALGLGAGASFLPLLTMGMADAPTRDAGLASGIINVSVQLFGAIGLATLGTIATDHTKALSASGHPLAERADRRLPPRLPGRRGVRRASGSSPRSSCCARPPARGAGDRVEEVEQRIAPRQSSRREQPQAAVTLSAA